jgi:hypothetical protein
MFGALVYPGFSSSIACGSPSQPDVRIDLLSLRLSNRSYPGTLDEADQRITGQFTSGDSRNFASQLSRAELVRAVPTVDPPVAPRVIAVVSWRLYAEPIASSIISEIDYRAELKILDATSGLLVTKTGICADERPGPRPSVNHGF